MEKTLTRILVMAAAFIAGAVLMPGNSCAEIKLGILPRLSAVEMHDMYTPLVNYLTKETGEKVVLVVPKDFDAFKALVKNKEVDLAYANSLIYVQLKKDVDLAPLALASEKKGGTKFRGIIIARKDSGIENIQDLKGKKLLFVEKNSAAGHIFQMLLLTKAGFDVDKDFTKLPFAGKHDNVSMAVFNKAADAGGIREDDLDKMKDKVDLSQIRIVAYSDYFPNWPVFSTPKMNKTAASKIQAALLKLKPGDPDAEKILSAAKLTGFVPTSDQEYDQLRQAAKIVGAF